MALHLLKCCVILMLVFPGSLNAQDIRSLMPGEGDLDNWIISEGPRVFVDDDLFELINGGADIYYEYGFRQVLSVDYLDPAQNNIQLEIYEMSDDSAAYGIFSLTQQAVEWGVQFGNISAVTNDYIAFWKGRYFSVISWASRQHEDNPPLAYVAGMVEERVADPGDYPALVRDFQMAHPAGKTVYMKGRLSLSNFYYFDYKDIFKIEEAIACTRGGHHRILFRYQDETQADDALASAKSAMMSNKRFSDIAVIYQGYTCRDNKGNRIMVRQVGRYLAVLVGLDPDISLVPLMDEVMHQIENSP